MNGNWECRFLLEQCTNWYVGKNIRKYLSLSSTEKIVSDTFKSNRDHFSMKKVQHFQLFRIKMKEY